MDGQDLDDIPTFAKRIKEKYPQYADLDDNELTERVVRKHPVYASRVKLPDGFRLLQTSSGYSKIDDIYEQMGREQNVDPNLLLEQGRQETINFKPEVMYGRLNSPAGARGAGQFMKGTAPTYGLRVDDEVDERTDPVKSIRAQAKYMRKLLDDFDNDESLALAGYNAGEYRDSLRNGQIPKIKETQDYVNIITGKLTSARKNGSLQNPFTAPNFSPDQSTQSFVNPDDLPKVSLGDLPAEMFQPKNQTAPLQNDIPITLPKPQGFTENLKTLNQQNPDLQGEKLPISNMPKPEELNKMLPPFEIPKPENRLPNDYQEFLKYSNLTDSDESKNLYSQTVLQPLAETEKAQNAQYEKDFENYNQNLTRPNGQENKGATVAPLNAQTPAAVEIPKNESRTATIDQRIFDPRNELADDSNARLSIAGSVSVDLSKKPNGVRLDEYLFRSAINQIGAKYNLTPEQKQTAEKVIRQSAGKLLRNTYDDITDDNYSDFLDEYQQNYGNSQMRIDLTRNAINTALTGDYNAPLSEAVRKDLQGEQNERNLDFYTSDNPVGKDDFQNNLTPRESSALQGRRNDEQAKQNNPEYQLRKRAEDNIYNSPLTGGTESEVLAEIERLKRMELSPETSATLQGIGTLAKNSVGNNFGGNSGIVSGLIGAGGGLADIIAGVNRPFAALGLTDGSAYEAWHKLGKGARILENSMKRDGIGGDIENLIGRSAIDIPKYAVMSALPGGAVVGFGLDSGLSSAGRNENLDEVLKQGAKGAALGSLFKLSNAVGNKVSNELLKPIAKIGTISAATYPVEIAFGATPEEAFKSSLMQGLFELTGSIGSLKGKTLRVWEKGKPREVTVDNKNNVLLLEGLEKSPVDIEMVLDPADNVYKPKARNENVTRESFVDDSGAIDADIEYKTPETDLLANKETQQTPQNEQNLTENSGLLSNKISPETKPAVLHKNAESVPAFDEMKNFSVETKDGVLVVNDAKLKDYFKENNLGYYDRNKAVWMIENGKLNAADISLHPVHEAATSPLNDLPEPTKAQIEAGNFKMSHIKVGGSDLTIEIPKGGKRRGTDSNGNDWERKLEHHYGYIKRSVGADNENIDVFVNDGTPENFDGNVYIVDQQKKNGSFDEHKIMLGYDSESAARSAYLSNYPKDWNGLKSIGKMSMPEFKTWVREGKKNIPVENQIAVRENTLPRIQGEAGPKAQNIESPENQTSAVETSAPLRASSNIGNQPHQQSLRLHDSPIKTTTRELDAKRLTKLDKRRADSINAEYEEVSGLPPSSLYKNAVIKFKDGNLFVNAEATELLRRADYIAFRDAESFSYYGRYLNPTNAQRISRALQINADSVFFDSHLDTKKADFVAEFEKARKASKLGDIQQIVTSKKAPYGMKSARQEETAHAKDYALGGQHKIAVDTFRRDKVGRSAMLTVKESGYENFSSSGLAREVAAKIWTDTATTDLKLSSDRIKHLRDLYLKSILKKGEKFADFENEFKRVSKSTRNYLQETKPKYEQRTELEPVGRNGRIDRRTEGNQRLDGKTFTEGTRESNATSSGNEGTRRNRINELETYERKFIESKTKGDTDLAYRVADEILYSRSKANDKMTVGDYVLDIANGIPRALKATLDWSAPGRQGWILTLSNPVAGAKSFKQQIASFFSTSVHKKFADSIDDHPLIDAMEDTGLYLSNRADKSDLNQREEQFMSRILGDEKLFSNEKLEAFRQGLTYPVRWSERAFSDYLDKLRIESYLHFAKEVYEFNERKGITDNETYQKQLEAVSKFINSATGRGNLGRFEDNAAVLNLPFFSVRNWKSRFDLINPAFYAAMSPGARGAALKSFGRFAGATALAFLLLSKSGIADIETDPDSPDFLKVRIGQYRFDISAAIVSQLRYVAQMAKGAYNGDAQGMAKTSLNYVRGKLSPTLSAVVSTALGTRISNEPTNVSKEAAGLIVPISIEQLTSAAKNDGTLGALLAAPDLLGFGVSRYENSEEVGFQLAELERQLAKAPKGSDEEKKLSQQIKAWRDYYFQARMQPGELPFFVQKSDTDDGKDKKDDNENVTYTDEKPEVKRLDLKEKIEFYKKNKDTLFSFAKDELESVILQDAENLRLRGRLTKTLESFVKEIIPEWSPIRENRPGIDLRPEKLPKIPNANKDLPKLPKPPKLPPIPSGNASQFVTDSPIETNYRGYDVFKTQYNPEYLKRRPSENVIDMRDSSPLPNVINAARAGTVAEINKEFSNVDLSKRTTAEREEITKELTDAIKEARYLRANDKTVEIEPDLIKTLLSHRRNLLRLNR